jgi:DNA polymerase-3 subunit gamma/tau
VVDTPVVEAPPSVAEPVRDETLPEAVAEPPASEPAGEQPSAPASHEPAATTPAGSTLTLVDVRRLWPDIVEATKQRRRVTWIHLTQQAQVVAVDDTTLTLGFGNAGARDSFDNGGSAEIVRQSAIDVVGHDWQVETIVDPGAVADGPPAAATPAAGRPAAPPPPADEALPEGGARHDDDDAESAGLDGAELLQQALGAQVIEEIPHQ